MDTQVQTALTPPSCVEERLQEIKALCEKYPVSIPLIEAAKCLRITPECLREAISNGSCPFGFSWLTNAGGHRGFNIQTHLFWMCMCPQFALKTTVRAVEASHHPYIAYFD